MHAAVAAIDPEPGDEFITTSITDMGAIAPILSQGAIPVFADVDASTCNVTADTIAAQLSDRTRAIVVTHLFGNPCQMEPIIALAKKHRLPIIEDCAQAYLATERGAITGTLGTIGIFSLQQGKHITCGEGGVSITSDDELARRMRLFINKGWDYHATDPDHRVLAPNYRMTELQGAVALAQLGKMDGMVAHRRRMASRLSNLLQDISGLDCPVDSPGSESAFWRYPLRVDLAIHPGGPVKLAGGLGRHGISAFAHYIKKPAFECEVFVRQKTFGKSRWPFTIARPEALDYSRVRYPGTYEGLERVVVLPWSERLSEADVDYIASAVRECLCA